MLNIYKTSKNRKKSKHLVVGMGEVGRAIHLILEDKFYTVGIDKDDILNEKFDVIHICIPYNKTFIKTVLQYKNKYCNQTGLVVIHSSVPVGITDKIGAVHSPIRGVHPNLEHGIRIFVKYFGGERAKEASLFFKDCKIKVKTTENAKNTEALKLWSTTYYGYNIIFEKSVYEYCEKHDLDFDLVYTDSNLSYNTGYKRLGRNEVLRPVLNHIKGEIGGHCVLPNAKLLGTKTGRYIIKQNKKLKGS